MNHTSKPDDRKRGFTSPTPPIKRMPTLPFSTHAIMHYSKDILLPIIFLLKDFKKRMDQLQNNGERDTELVIRRQGFKF